MNTQKYTVIAIDIAKLSLQVQTENTSFELTNDALGHEELRKRLNRLERPYVACEATGGYERPLVRMLYDADIAVSVINPALVRAFARSEGVKAKTDPIDAKLLLKFAQSKELRLSQRPDPAREKLGALMDRRTHLSATLTREKNRLEKQPIHTRELIEKSIAFLEDQIEEVDTLIDETICQNEALSQSVDRITEVKGVGKTTAHALLAYMPELETLSRAQLISLAGLAPFNKDSGTTKQKAFIHGGRAKIRRCLYMAAQSAARFNPVIKEYVSKLITRGKPYKSALVAAMRKILICIQSLIKNPNFSLD